MKAIAVVISLQIYIYALTQTAFFVDYSSGKFSGSECLLWGALYLSRSYSWLANFTLLASWGLLFLKNQLFSFAASAVTLILMLSFLSATTVLVAETPTYAKITSYGRGYYAWIASSAVTMLANIFFFFKNFSTSKKVVND